MTRGLNWLKKFFSQKERKVNEGGMVQSSERLEQGHGRGAIPDSISSTSVRTWKFP